MNRFEIGKQIYDNASLNGKFRNYAKDSNPKFWNSVVENFATLIPYRTQVLAGLEGERIPLTLSLSRLTCLPYIMVGERLTDEIEMPIEAVGVLGRSVCIVVDYVDSGEYIREQVRRLRGMEANVGYVICLIEQEGNGRNNIEKIDPKLWLNSYFRADELKVLGQLK